MLADPYLYLVPCLWCSIFSTYSLDIVTNMWHLGSNGALFVPLPSQLCSNMFNFHFFSYWCFLLSLISSVKWPKHHDISLYPFEMYRVLCAFLLQGNAATGCTSVYHADVHTMTMIVVSCHGGWHYLRTLSQLDL